MSQIKSLTDEEVIKIMLELDTRMCLGKKKKMHVRNRLVVLLMLDAGFRVSEVAKTKRGALMFASEFVETVTVSANAAKLKIERSIPTTERLKDTLRLMDKYSWQPDNVPATGHAIYASSQDKPLDVRQLRRIVGHISRIAIGREINPHMLRHTFATRLMKKANIRVVQELLGHKCLTSTQIYTHPNGQDLKSAIGELN